MNNCIRFLFIMIAIKKQKKLMDLYQEILDSLKQKSR